MSLPIVLTHGLRSVPVLKAAEPRPEDVKNVMEVTWMLNSFSLSEHYAGMAKWLFVLGGVQDVVPRVPDSA